MGPSGASGRRGGVRRAAPAARPVRIREQPPRRSGNSDSAPSPRPLPSTIHYHRQLSSVVSNSFFFGCVCVCVSRTATFSALYLVLIFFRRHFRPFCGAGLPADLPASLVGAGTGAAAAAVPAAVPAAVATAPAAPAASVAEENRPAAAPPAVPSAAAAAAAAALRGFGPPQSEFHQSDLDKWKLAHDMKDRDNTPILFTAKPSKTR